MIINAEQIFGGILRWWLRRCWRRRLTIALRAQKKRRNIGCVKVGEGCAGQEYTANETQPLRKCSFRQLFREIGAYHHKHINTIIPFIPAQIWKWFCIWIKKSSSFILLDFSRSTLSFSLYRLKHRLFHCCLSARHFPCEIFIKHIFTWLNSIAQQVVALHMEMSNGSPHKTRALSHTHNHIHARTNKLIKTQYINGMRLENGAKMRATHKTRALTDEK